MFDLVRFTNPRSHAVALCVALAVVQDSAEVERQSDAERIPEDIEKMKEGNTKVRGKLVEVLPQQRALYECERGHRFTTRVIQGFEGFVLCPKCGPGRLWKKPRK